MARLVDEDIQIFVLFSQAESVKPIDFRGDSQDVIRALPGSVRRKVGQQLELLQWGGEPDDWKPMPTVGADVREIRVRDDQGIYRVIYVAKFAHAICVLHCFQKKTQKTSKSDLDLAVRRYKELQKEMER
jgi:phage-related protein